MNIIQLIKNIIPFVYPYRRIVAFTLLLTLIGAFVVQINAWVLRYTVDRVNELIDLQQVIQQGSKLLLFILVIFIGKEVLSIAVQLGQRYYSDKLRIFISRDLAQTVVEKVLTYRLAFFQMDDNKAGKLQTRIDKGVEGLTRIVQNFFIDILPLFASSMIALIMMFMANVYVGLISLFVIPIYIFVSQKQAKRLSGSRRNIRKFRENKSHGIIGILESIPVIKSFVREDIEANKQLGLQIALTTTQIETRKVKSVYEALQSLIEQVGLTCVVLLTVYFVLKGQMTVGTIMFNILLFNNVSAPIRQLNRIYDEVNDAFIYSEGLFSVLAAEDQVEGSGGYIPEQIKGKFEIKNVDFSYPDGTQALFNVNMTIPAGKITALVGLSGAGKSTVINLLDKFYHPDNGDILLDGVSLSEYNTSYLRHNIGLVLQKNHIFSGTIEENIRYGNPDATKEAVKEAAKKAYIHEQIITFPAKYQTNALNLSGGQQQRIAIARMFLKNPPIIFLDEPTASLDAIATEQIKNSIDAIKQNRTVIIISHSISQIIDSDMIYVMKEGHVVEQGQHDDIYRLEGTYNEIFNAMARSLNIDKISKTIDQYSD